MKRALLIFTAIATFAVAGAVTACSWASDRAGGSSMSKTTNAKAIGDESWTARMGWRYVAYVEGEVEFWLPIDPMVKGDDRVYVPDEASWLKAAPAATKNQRSEILARLKSAGWNRKLSWQECDCPLAVGPPVVIPGSLESTAGGQALEDRRLFEPGSKVKPEEAHDLWHEGARMFAEQATGTVTIFMSELIPDSVFQAIELPALKKNPNVTLLFK